MDEDNDFDAFYGEEQFEHDWDDDPCSFCTSDDCEGCVHTDPCTHCDLMIECRDCRVYQENREDPDYGPYDGGFEEPDFCDTVPEDAYGDAYPTDEAYFGNNPH